MSEGQSANVLVDDITMHGPGTSGMLRETGENEKSKCSSSAEQIHKKGLAFSRRTLQDPDPLWKDRTAVGSHRKGVDWLYRVKMKRHHK